MSRSNGRVFGFRHLAGLEPRLSFEQRLAQASLVVHLGVGGQRDLVEHEPEAVDQQRVQNEHVRMSRRVTVARYARSSFRRMLTKLYGGQGPCT